MKVRSATGQWRLLSLIETVAPLKPSLWLARGAMLIDCAVLEPATRHPKKRLKEIGAIVRKLVIQGFEAQA